MDYGFAPGATPYDLAAATLLRLRTNTELKSQVPIAAGSTIQTTLARIDEFLNYLETGTGITRPADDILLGGHGNSRGNFFVPFMFSLSNQTATTYEVLVTADTTNVNDIPSAMRDADTKIKIRGCNIGQTHALPFLQKMKAAFGGNVTISAPKHFHNIGPISGTGVIESFAYELKIYRLQPFPATTAGRTQLIDAFMAKTFSFISTNPITRDWYEHWIPSRSRINTIRQLDFLVNLNPAIPVAGGSTMPSTTLQLPKAYRSKNEDLQISFGGISTNPGNAAARRARLLQAMRAHPSFAPTHPFSYPKRYEFNTMAELEAAFNWTATYNSNTNTLIGVGRRRAYTLILPITTDPHLTDTTKNHLIFNFFPDPANVNAQGNMVSNSIGINESDARIFQIV